MSEISRWVSLNHIQYRVGIPSRVVRQIRHHLRLDTGFLLFICYSTGSRYTSPVHLKDHRAPAHQLGLGEPSLGPIQIKNSRSTRRDLTRYRCSKRICPVQVSEIRSDSGILGLFSPCLRCGPSGEIYIYTSLSTHILNTRILSGPCAS